MVIRVHAYERTMLAQLGLQDPDRRNSKHTLACQYIAQEEVATRLCQLVMPEEYRDFVCSLTDNFRSDRVFTIQGHTIPVVKHEVAITKGQGRYLSVIGFWDVVIEMELMGVYTFKNKYRPSG